MDKTNHTQSHDMGKGNDTLSLEPDNTADESEVLSADIQPAMAEYLLKGFL